VDGAAQVSEGKFTLTFGGGPSAGAFFLVTSANRDDGPWTYTTEAGKTLSDTWNTAHLDGHYDLTAHGPNGFLRTFKGEGKEAGPEVTARHLKAGGDIELTMTNAGTSDCRLTVTNAYGGAKETFKVRAGARVVRKVSLRAGKSWYDLSVTSDTDDTWSRRLAGHVETGAPGVSDPATLTA
jgi:phospholipase C